MAYVYTGRGAQSYTREKLQKNFQKTELKTDLLGWYLKKGRSLLFVSFVDWYQKKEHQTRHSIFNFWEKKKKVNNGGWIYKKKSAYNLVCPLCVASPDFTWTKQEEINKKKKREENICWRTFHSCPNRFSRYFDIGFFIFFFFFLLALLFYVFTTTTNCVPKV